MYCPHFNKTEIIDKNTVKPCYLVIYWTKIKLGDIHCIHVKIWDTEVELCKRNSDLDF